MSSGNSQVSSTDVMVFYILVTNTFLKRFNFLLCLEKVER